MNGEKNQDGQVKANRPPPHHPCSHSWKSLPHTIDHCPCQVKIPGNHLMISLPNGSLDGIHLGWRWQHQPPQGIYNYQFQLLCEEANYLKQVLTDTLS